jgi:hypothetical protein
MTRLSAMKQLVQPLPPGALDIVGDVHGEITALQQLLHSLGYDADGNHSGQRTLVFVGDLGDRGPDSPATYSLVHSLWQSSRAVCVLGNHELNLLREDTKDGNGWAFADNHDRLRHKYLHSRDADSNQRASIRHFIGQLPVALEREDLRIAHACWNESAIATLRDEPLTDVICAFDKFEANADRRIRSAGVSEQAGAQRQAFDLTDETVVPPILDAIGREDELRQMENPLRVLTSGAERYGTAPYYSGGRWRMTNRVAWWNDYAAAVPVVFGHYWRPVVSDVNRQVFGKNGPDLFAATTAADWLGPHRNAFCVDFSVGLRYRERQHGYEQGTYGRLAAMRWPERELVFDNGERVATS